MEITTTYDTSIFNRIPARTFKIDDKTKYLLDENSEKIDTPTTLKLGLYDYQLGAIQEICKLEENRTIEYSLELSKEPEIYRVISNNCILNLPYGAGKSIIVLGLLSYRKFPAKSELFITPAIEGITEGKKEEEALISCLNMGLNMFRKPIDENAYIVPSIIVVAPQVFNQWTENIKRFTNFKTFFIYNALSIKQFHKCVEDGSINKYDIILIKHCKIACDISNYSYIETLSKKVIMNRDIRYTETVNAKATDEYDIMHLASAILSKHVCPWLIHDDFDFNVFQSTTKNINASYNVYISATPPEDKSLGSYTGYEIIDYTNFIDLLKYEYSTRADLIKYDRDNNKYFTVTAEKKYIDESVSLPQITIKTLIVRSEYDRFIDAIGNLGELDAAEGLNANAVQTVMAKIGCTAEAANPVSVFHKVFNTKYTEYKETFSKVLSATILQHINDKCKKSSNSDRNVDMNSFIRSITLSVKENAVKDPKFKELVDNIDFDQTENVKFKNAKLLEAISTYLEKPEFIKNLEAVDRNMVNMYCDDIIAANLPAMKEAFTLIERVKSNLRDGDCQVCCTPLEDVMIPTCCSISVCGHCIKKAFHLRKVNKDEFENGQANKNILARGVCPNCRKEVAFPKDVVYVTADANFSVDSIVNFGIAETITTEVTAAKSLVTPDTKAPSKYDVLKGIYSNDKAAVDTFLKETITNYKIKNLIDGTKDKPQPDNLVRKILVFFSYEESINELCEYLTENAMNFIKFNGNHNALSQKVKEFREATIPTILIVNSSKICSGVDIQFATDIVFMHKIHNKDIEGQLSGRAQRVGRQFNLNIYYILYENEQKYLKESN